MTVERGAITTGAEQDFDVEASFDIEAPVEPGEGRIVLVYFPACEIGDTGLSNFQVTSSVEGADVGLRVLKAQDSVALFLVAAAVALPDAAEDAAVTFTFIPQAASPGTVRVKASSLVVTGAQAADAALGYGFASSTRPPSSDPMALGFSTPAATDFVFAFGANVGTVAGGEEINGDAVDAVTSIAIGGDIGSVRAAIQAPLTDQNTGNAEYVCNSLPFAALVFAFGDSSGGGGGGGLCADITGFNCTPYPDNDNLTLAEYRAKLLIRAGFAAVASNPPPGTAALFNSFLQDAQDFLYKKYPALETRWIFRWSLEEGVRYYGIRDNDGLEGDCSIFMDPYKNIEGAWLVDLNGQWLPMAFGIPPASYTTVNNPALPFRLEIRQCVEIFPAPPADGYLLMIKGHFGKQPFTEDDDKPTIDGQLVYLWALANALDYYGKPSAAGIATQANDYLGQLVAGTHTGKRYIPGTRPANPAIVPVYAPWPGEY